METWANEALEAMRASPYASNEIKAAMQMRWSQRDSILQGVKQYVQACLNEKEALLLESKQRSVPAGEDDAERDQEAGRWTN